MHEPVRSGFETSNRDEGEAMIAAAYAQNRLRVSGGAGDFRMAQDRIDIGEVKFDHFGNTLTVDYHVAPLPSLMVMRQEAGVVEIDTGAYSAQAFAGDILLGPLPGKEYHARVDGAWTQMTALDFSLLDQVTDEPGEALTRPYRTDPLDPVAGRRWQRTVDYVTDTVLADDAATSPLVLGSAGRLLAATFVTVFDPDPARGRPSDRVDATPDSVRRAIAFIEANPDLSIGVADIARASYVSVRSLQIAFRRHLDTTPMRYLRGVRLDLARRDLQCAVPGDGTTVTDIAARWGYADLSRFAAEYRAAYGEHPHVTLKGLDS